jgi:hypothetical protein
MVYKKTAACTILPMFLYDILPKFPKFGVRNCISVCYFYGIAAAYVLVRQMAASMSVTPEQEMPCPAASQSGSMSQQSSITVRSTRLSLTARRRLQNQNIVTSKFLSQLAEVLFQAFQQIT